MEKEFELNEEDIVNKEEYSKFKIDNQEVSLLCPICECIFIDPYYCSSCQNSFCKSCLEHWKSKNNGECIYRCKNSKFAPSRMILPNLKRLRFKCQNGCNLEIEYQNIEEHYKNKCPKLAKNQFDRTDLVKNIELLQKENKALKKQNASLKKQKIIYDKEKIENTQKISLLEKEVNKNKEEKRNIMEELSLIKKYLNNYLKEQKKAENDLIEKISRINDNNKNIYMEEEEENEIKNNESFNLFENFNENGNEQYNQGIDSNNVININNISKIENSKQNNILSSIVNENILNKSQRLILEESFSNHKTKTKCIYYPNCKNKDCTFLHPTEKCPYYPKCKYGDKCIYIHPSKKCKFGAKCTNKNCPFDHS